METSILVTFGGVPVRECDIICDTGLVQCSSVEVRKKVGTESRGPRKSGCSERIRIDAMSFIYDI